MPKARARKPTTFHPGSNVLGQGGFGVVVSNARTPAVAHKLMKNHMTCSSAAKEYDIHKRVYAVYQRFVAAHPKLRAVIAVPKPFQLSPCKERTCVGRSCYPCGPPYHCMYSMQRVRSGRADSLMRHVMLNTWYPTFQGTIQFVRHNAQQIKHTEYVNNEMRKKNKPRGAFLGAPQLRAAGLDLGTLAHSMGMLYQLVYVAGSVPKDVEYVLGMPPASRAKASIKGARCLWAMDFGMADDADFDPELDMYIPQAPAADDPANFPNLLTPFEQGRSLVKAWARGARNM